MSKSAEMLKCFESIQPLKKAYEAYSETLEELRESAGRNQDPRFKKMNDDQIRILEEQKERAHSVYIDSLTKAERYVSELEEHGKIMLSALIRFRYLCGKDWQSCGDLIGTTEGGARQRVKRYFLKLENGKK